MGKHDQVSAAAEEARRATGGAAGGIVKLTKSSSIDPQDTELQPVANPPCWASKTTASLNLTVPRPERDHRRPSSGRGTLSCTWDGLSTSSIQSGLPPRNLTPDCRVAPGDCSPEALTRTGLGGFHHPALPLMWLMAMRPRFARESEARAEDIVPTTQRTSAR